jgi:hypothetical protein
MTSHPFNTAFEQAAHSQSGDDLKVRHQHLLTAANMMLANMHLLKISQARSHMIVLIRHTLIENNTLMMYQKNGYKETDRDIIDLELIRAGRALCQGIGRCILSGRVRFDVES